MNGDKTPKDGEQPTGEGEVDDSGGEDDDGEEEDEDENEFTIFFERDEIQSTKEHQQYDAFEDIRQQKAEMMMLHRGRHPSDDNRIRIQEFMPKESSKDIPQGKRKGGSKSYKSSHTGDMMDERHL